MSNPTPILAISITNAGGEGKTTWSETLAGLARLGNRKVSVADIDPGNHGYLNRNGDESAARLDWAGLEYDAGDPVGWFDRHVRHQDLTILDTGANMLPAQGKTNQFLLGLLRVAAQNGVQVIFYCITSPNKPGSAALVELMFERFSQAGKIVIVQNDRDGSTAFEESLALLGATIVRMPYIEPGLQAVRLRRPIPLDETLHNPEAGYERATATIAAKLISVAQQSGVREVVGDEVCKTLKKLGADAVGKLLYTVPTIQKASNSSLTANERVLSAWQSIQQPEMVDDANLLVAARALLAAIAGWKAVA